MLLKYDGLFGEKIAFDPLQIAYMHSYSGGTRITTIQKEHFIVKESVENLVEEINKHRLLKSLCKIGASDE